MTADDLSIENEIRKAYNALVGLINLAHSQGLSVHIEPIDDKGQGNTATLHLGGAFIGVSKAL